MFGKIAARSIGLLFLANTAFFALGVINVFYGNEVGALLILMTLIAYAILFVYAIGLKLLSWVFGE